MTFLDDVQLGDTHVGWLETFTAQVVELPRITARHGAVIELIEVHIKVAANEDAPVFELPFLQIALEVLERRHRFFPPFAP